MCFSRNKKILSEKAKERAIFEQNEAYEHAKSFQLSFVNAQKLKQELMTQVELVTSFQQN